MCPLATKDLPLACTLVFHIAERPCAEEGKKDFWLNSKIMMDY